jgi:hypothetical protein
MFSMIHGTPKYPLSVVNLEQNFTIFCLRLIFQSQNSLFRNATHHPCPYIMAIFIRQKMLIPQKPQISVYKVESWGNVYIVHRRNKSYHYCKNRWTWCGILLENICCKSWCWNTKLIVIQGTVIRIVSDAITEGLKFDNPTVRSYNSINWWANILMLQGVWTTSEFWPINSV